MPLRRRDDEALPRNTALYFCAYSAVAPRKRDDEALTRKIAFRGRANNPILGSSHGLGTIRCGHTSLARLFKMREFFGIGEGYSTPLFRYCAGHGNPQMDVVGKQGFGTPVPGTCSRHIYIRMSCVSLPAKSILGNTLGLFRSVMSLDSP